MPKINTDILVWARETAGLSRSDAAQKVGLKEAHGASAEARLEAIETGTTPPSRALLVKMAQQYRRPLLTFYLSRPPRKGDRGQDFRTLPDTIGPSTYALVDALIRDVRARQLLVRSVFEDEEASPLGFIGSSSIDHGTDQFVSKMRHILHWTTPAKARGNESGDAFAELRAAVERVGVFVLLIGNLGSHHTAMDVDIFRGLALSDEIAPFIVINDQDSKAAWSFTLLHEFAHLMLGVSGVSGFRAEGRLERFCNDAASEFLLPSPELILIGVGPTTPLEIAQIRISDFATSRGVSSSMVAYKLMRAGLLSEQNWRSAASFYKDQWLEGRERRRDRAREREGGPDYYVVKRHRLGNALTRLVRQTLESGDLSPSKAGKILGVKPRNLAPLLLAESP